MSGKDNPQAILGAFRQPTTTIATLDRSTSPLWLVAQSLRDPGNIGTILRTGDAVGAGGLILIDDCADPFSVEAVRASMGAVFTQDVATARWDEFLSWLRSGPGELVVVVAAQVPRHGLEPRERVDGRPGPRLVAEQREHRRRRGPPG